MLWYANVKPLASDPVMGGNIAHLATIGTLGYENAPIETEADLRRLITEREIKHLMFYRTDFPQRAVPIEKAEKWICKLGRELGKAS